MNDKISEKAVWENTEVEERVRVTPNLDIQFCYSCGMEIPPDSEFCPSCGIQLYLDCPKCKSKFLSKYAFCPKCGTNREAFLVEMQRIQKEKLEKQRQEEERELAKKIAVEKEKAGSKELIRLVNEEIVKTPEFIEALNFLIDLKPLYVKKWKRGKAIDNILSKGTIILMSAFGGIFLATIVATIAEWFDLCLWDTTLLYFIGIGAAVVSIIYFFIEFESWGNLKLDNYIPCYKDLKKKPVSSNLEKLIFNQMAYSKREFGWDSNKLEQWLISSYRNVYVIGLDTVPYAWLTEKPIFKSQNSDFYHWIKKNIEYPIEAKKNRIEGEVIVTFTVNKLGHVEDVNIKQGSHPLLDTEVVRVISSSPQWTPGRFKGIAVPVRYHHTETFKI